MPDFRTMFDRDYIYAYDLQGKDVPVTISVVKGMKLKGNDQKEQKKPVLWFVEAKDGRGLALCKTNAKIIAALYGNNTDQWIGKRITLYPTTTDAFGKTVECIRVRPQAPRGKNDANTLRDANDSAPADSAAAPSGSDQPGLV